MRSITPSELDEFERRMLASSSDREAYAIANDWLKKFNRIAEELRRFWAQEENPLYQVDCEGRLMMICKQCKKEHKK